MASADPVPQREELAIVEVEVQMVVGVVASAVDVVLYKREETHKPGLCKEPETRPTALP
jgi:hypothetical protein